MFKHIFYNLMMRKEYLNGKKQKNCPAFGITGQLFCFMSVRYRLYFSYGKFLATFLIMRSINSLALLKTPSFISL